MGPRRSLFRNLARCPRHRSLEEEGSRNSCRFVTQAFQVSPRYFAITRRAITSSICSAAEPEAEAATDARDESKRYGQADPNDGSGRATPARSLDKSAPIVRPDLSFRSGTLCVAEPKTCLCRTRIRDRCSYGCQGVIEFFPFRAVATLDIPADAVESMTRPARQRVAVRSTRQKSSVPTTMATRWTRRQTEVPFRVGADSWAWAGQGRATWEGKLLLGDKSSAACAGFGTRRRAGRSF